MKVQLAIIGAVLIVGAILFFPETTSQVSEGTSVFDALVTDAINIKEYNSHTSQVGDTIYDVSIKVSETMVDVTNKAQDTIGRVETVPNQILNLEG